VEYPFIRGKMNLSSSNFSLFTVMNSIVYAFFLESDPMTHFLEIPRWSDSKIRSCCSFSSICSLPIFRRTYIV